MRRVDLETGAAELQSELPEDLFGEGLARVGDRLYQLSWRAGRLLVYEVASLDLVDEKAYAGQGWGLCYTAPYLVRSDSTHTLVFHDAVSFEEVLRLPVTLDGEPLPLVNELECAEGWIYGNVWQQETIARIDPDSGHVVALIDASGLLTPAERKGTDVLNGIAYRPEAGTFLLTGKYWPKVFEVVFVEEESP